MTPEKQVYLPGESLVERLLAQEFVRHIHFRDETTSTNDLAIRAAADAGLAVPALFFARRQSQGRGRENRRWWSPAGSLALSLVIEPEAIRLAPHRWPELSLIVAVSVRNLVASLLPQHVCRTKHPNDVLLDGRKVCGILIELPNCPGVSRRRAVIGVGLNVNNRAADAPDEIRDQIVSLADAAKKPFPLDDILLGLLSAIENRCAQLASGFAPDTETMISFP